MDDLQFSFINLQLGILLDTVLGICFVLIAREICCDNPKLNSTRKNVQKMRLFLKLLFSRFKFHFYSHR